MRDLSRGFFDKGKLKEHQLKHIGVKLNCFILGCASTVSRKNELIYRIKKIHRLNAKKQQNYMKNLC